MKMFNGLRRLFSGRATSIQEGQQDGTPDTYNSSAAAFVNEDTALQVSSFWAGVRLLTETFACLPVSVYERATGKKVGVGGLWGLVDILTRRPNSRQTALEFYETMQLNLVVHGNCFARIVRTASGRIVALWPLAAQNTVPVLGKDGRVVYHHFHGTDVTVYADENILHVKLFGNGLVGLSPLSYARNSIGLASAADQYASKYFVNGGKPSGVLYTDAALTKEQRASARESFTEIVEERDESRRLLVLPLSFKYQQVQMSPADMQMLETRRYQLEDIARFLGVPSILINDNEKTSTWGSGIEQILIGWYRLNFKPYPVRWEQALERKLLTASEKLKYKIRFDFDSLLQGDSKTHMESLKGMVGGPIMTPNEGREKVNLPPVEGGDRLNPAPTESRKGEADSSNTFTDKKAA